MQKNDLMKQMKDAHLSKNTLDIRLYIPTKDEFVYMQVGSGDNLDAEDVDECGEPYNSYIDYTQLTWNEDEFDDVDGGMYMYRYGHEDDQHGELINRAYEALAYMYGDEAVEDENFAVVILEPSAYKKH